MDKISILAILKNNNIETVLIGGLALTFYKSPRLTYDIDLACRTIDVDKIIYLLYKHNFYLISLIEEAKNLIHICLEPQNAIKYLNNSKSGSATLVSFLEKKEKKIISQTDAHPENVVDLLYELPVPIMKLMANSNKIRIKDMEIKVASLEDLLILKEKRRDKSNKDIADIEYIKKKLKK